MTIKSDKAEERNFVISLFVCMTSGTQIAFGTKFVDSVGETYKNRDTWY